MSKKEDIPQPPQAPDIEKRLHLNPLQWIGIPLIMLVPILTLFGVFGFSTAELDAASADLSVNGEYVTRFRYKMIGSMAFEVENLTESTMPTVTIAFDRDYVDSFSTVTFNPTVKEITEDAYLVELTNIAPGEVRVVAVEIQAEAYFRHDGIITVTAPGADPVSVDVATWVFP